MSLNLYMANRQRSQFTAQGDFLFVEAATGLVQIETNTGGHYQLSQGAQIKSALLNNARVTVENLGDEGTITLKVGFGEYIAPQRESVAISSLPKVELEADQSLKVSELPAVTLVQGQAVNISSLPAVILQPNQSIHVASGNQLTAHGSVMPLTVAANANRKGVIIKAHRDNTGVIDLAGFELAAGESLTVNTTADITLTGAASDSAQVLEF